MCLQQCASQLLQAGAQSETVAIRFLSGLGRLDGFGSATHSKSVCLPAARGRVSRCLKGYTVGGLLRRCCVAGSVVCEGFLRLSAAG